ncbi:hypothetical protein HK098_002101 [Nowakowskiella sp. JEL0407]|nr:hypothetical protein HK098_002101 [Nowakowskiella sp. JEL0407]
MGILLNSKRFEEDEENITGAQDQEQQSVQTSDWIARNSEYFNDISYSRPRNYIHQNTADSLVRTEASGTGREISRVRMRNSRRDSYLSTGQNPESDLSSASEDIMSNYHQNDSYERISNNRVIPSTLNSFTMNECNNIALDGGMGFIRLNIVPEDSTKSKLSCILKNKDLEDELSSSDDDDDDVWDDLELYEGMGLLTLTTNRCCNHHHSLKDAILSKSEHPLRKYLVMQQLREIRRILRKQVSALREQRRQEYHARRLIEERELGIRGVFQRVSIFSDPAYFFQQQLETANTTLVPPLFRPTRNQHGISGLGGNIISNRYDSPVGFVSANALQRGFRFFPDRGRRRRRTPSGNSDVEGFESEDEENRTNRFRIRPRSWVQVQRSEDAALSNNEPVLSVQPENRLNLSNAHPPNLPTSMDSSNTSRQEISETNTTFTDPNEFFRRWQQRTQQSRLTNIGTERSSEESFSLNNDVNVASLNDDNAEAKIENQNAN